MAQTKVKLVSNGVITVDNLHTNHGITTDHIGEGSALYYSDARVANYLTTNNYVTQESIPVVSQFLTSISLTGSTLSYVDEDNVTTNIDLSSLGYLTSFTETDPIYVASSWYTTTNNSSNWDTAHGWGDHSLVGYLTTETDPVFSASAAAGITSTNITNWNTAYGWGDHSTQSYATETYVNTAIANLVDTAPTTLDTLNELAAALGDDPNFATTVSTSIGTKWTQDNTKISNWDTAYGWGNHASAGYLTSFTESDPTVPAHVKSITSTNISNWNTAYGWGNHASAGYAAASSLSSYLPLTGGTISGVINLNDSGYLKGSPTYGFRFNNSVDSINALIVDNSGNSIAYSSHRAPIFYDSNNTGYYLDPAGASELSTITTGTRARFGEPIWWTDRQQFSSDQGYWTGTNGWGTANGTWDDAWKGGFSGWDIWGENSAHPQGASYKHAQGIVSGLHYSNSSGTSAYGWMMVGAHNATENRYWLRGKWATSTSGWVEMYTTGNMDAPNKSGTSYYQTNTWLQFNGGYGLYWPNNYGAHFYPNDFNTHTQFRLNGSKNSYGGIVDSYSGVNGIMYDSAGNGGVYREANGRWYFYHHVGNNCTGINTSTTSASYGLYVSKGIYSTDDIVAYSDARKKTNINTIDSALDKVNKLRGVYYDRIDDLERGRQVGVIAQEVNEVLPEAVTYAEDIDEYGVKYGNIVGVLIEAIKEQQKQIEELKQLINK